MIRALGISLLVAPLLSLPSLARAQANGTLQLHFMDVGQGDGALLISPRGETVLFDNGEFRNCDKPVSYLQQLGVSEIAYHIASHYHSDHIGCAAPIFQEFPLQREAIDRGFSYRSKSFDNYLVAVGDKRRSATPGRIIQLDADSPHPVRVEIVALNGNSVDTDDENDLSLVAVVRFGDFDAVIGGDLSGTDTERYRDVETSVAPKVGRVELYKANHHGSRHSSNGSWLRTVKPLIAVISAGSTNTYGHPTRECLDRLHAEEIRTYWTSRGNGAAPDPAYDTVGGNIIVEVKPGGQTFSVTHSGTRTDEYASWPSPGGTPSPIPVARAYAWSTRSKVYHLASCSYVENISPGNLQTGATPPGSKRLHQGCPR